MDTVKEFEFKQKKYMPIFPKAHGTPTVYIEGYPSEEENPMPATESHGIHKYTFYDQLWRHFEICVKSPCHPLGNDHIHIGIDSFIYYSEGDISKRVAPDVYVIFGVAQMPPRSSFYARCSSSHPSSDTWKEGAVPAAVFEFLSESTATQDRTKKVQQYLIDIGVEEYFIHQPALDAPPVFRGWRRCPSGDIVEMAPDDQGSLLSESLNLWLRWEIDPRRQVRLLRPYLPDGTSITTSTEEQHLRLEAQAIAVEAEARAAAEAERRREETQRRREAEAELERLRAQLANRQDEGA